MVETVVSILLILIPLGIIAFKYLAKRITEGLTGYMTEKGKNLATKEDIEEITKKVEGVRSYFTDRTEKLKSDLSADIQRQLSIFGKRNEAMTQFFEDSSAAATFLSTPLLFSHEDLDGFDRHIRQGKECFVRADLSYRRLRLYAREESILTTAYNAATAISTLHITWFEKMMDCRDAFVIEAAEWKSAFETGNFSFFEGDARYRPSRQAFDKLWQAIGGPLNVLEGSLNEYTNALNAHFYSVDNSKALAATTGDSPKK